MFLILLKYSLHMSTFSVYKNLTFVRSLKQYLGYTTSYFMSWRLCNLQQDIHPFMPLGRFYKNTE